MEAIFPGSFHCEASEMIPVLLNRHSLQCMGYVTAQNLLIFVCYFVLSFKMSQN